MGRLGLPVISATSPTLAETMRLCLLRAGLSRTTGSSAFVLGNPKSWLGTAYHEVLEKIAEVDFERENIDAVIDRLWNQAIAVQHQHSLKHSLDHRFGVPEKWPGYYIARASVSLRARELVAARPAQSEPATSTGVVDAGGTIRERKFTAFGGRLVGQPDVIRTRAREIIDYKSGTIFELDETSQAEVVKTAYARQLRTYGYLVKETLGWWPKRGTLLPLAGVGAEVALELL